jgi:hypothetical protein
MLSMSTSLDPPSMGTALRFPVTSMRAPTPRAHRTRAAPS